MRILIVDAPASCRLTIASADSAGDLVDRVEIVEVTRAELERHASDSWDLMITHVHESRIDTTPVRASFVEPQQLDASRPARAAILGRTGIFRKLFRRGKVSPFEREKQRATATVVLAEIQREIGVALSAIEMGDFDAIAEIASRLKNDGANYNFAKLSGLGAALYDTVPNRDIRTARNIAQKLMTYMGKTIGNYAA